MHLWAIILAFTMASCALPLGHVTQVPSWLKLDSLKRANEDGAFRNSTVPMGDKEPSIDVIGRGKDIGASIDIAKRAEQSNRTIDVAKRDDESDAINSSKLTNRLGASVFVA